MTPRAKQAQGLLDDIDAIVEKALEDYNVPGIAVGVVVDGQLVYSKGFGYRDLEKQLPVTQDTLFAIGSCTKAFTSFLMGTLVDEGLVEWDQPVIDVLPEFRLQNQYATQNVTLRDILSHRSGMPPHNFMLYNSSMDRAEVMRRLCHLEPSCDIRERYQYNNLMYLTAGYVMEQITRKKWEELVTERILTPLKMHRTNFSVEVMQAAEDVATPYIEKEETLKKMKFRNLSSAGPAGSINSCVSDLAAWVTMQISGGCYENKPLISPATLQEIHNPQVVIPGAPECKEVLINTYGLGWYVSSYRGQYCVSHDGISDGFTSVVGFLPHSNVGVIVLANRNLTRLPRDLSLFIMDRVLGLSYIDWLKEGLNGVRKSKETMEEDQRNEDRLRKKETSPSHPLEDYVGEYVHPGYGTISVELCDGKFQTTFNGITSLLDHWHYDVFAIEEELQEVIFSLKGTKMVFRSNVDGDIEELAIPFESNAPEIVFKKVFPESATDLSYLRRFAGFYEINGRVVEIAVRNKGLCAVIPGQPLFELVPTGENEFTVKSMGYPLRFTLNSEGKVEEAMLVLPYGALAAKPKNLPLNG